MKKSQSPYKGFRFPAAVISCAVRWYHRFNLSLRDVEELLLVDQIKVVTVCEVKMSLRRLAPAMKGETVVNS